jgi:glycosyltransferase involved in cell wall biosynthesis
MRLTYSSVINSLSMGNVSFNFLKELWRKEVDVSFFPLYNTVDTDAYLINDEGFIDWVNKSISGRLKKINPDSPTLKLWHINGAENRVTRDQYLYTFYELDQPTDEEISLVNAQNHVFFSSKYAADTFISNGVSPNKVSYVPLGFDESFYKIDKKDDDIVTFSLMGKWEKRKHTEKIIKLWVKKFGNNIRYQLNCLVSNPFFKDKMEAIILNALGGERYFNVNFISFLEENSQVNSFINQADIDLTGLSGAEGWNLPAFNSACLGKWPVVLDATAHKDWATDKNSVLVSPNGQETAVDNVFFFNNQPFNQGRIFTWDEDEVVSAMEKAIELHKSGVNKNGELLKEKFSYSNTIDQILNKIK